MLPVLPLSLLAACAPERPARGTDGPLPSGTSPACVVSAQHAIAISPPLDATSVMPWTRIEAELLFPDPTATLVLRDETGAEIEGTTAVEEATLRFTPDENLQRSTIFEARVAWICGAHRWSFRTAGDGPIDPVTLTGRTWLLDLGAGRWFTNDLLRSQFWETGRLIEVAHADATGITFVQALASPETGAQELCQPTMTLPAGPLETNPSFENGAFSLATGNVDTENPVGVQQTVLSGVFTEDGALLDARLEG